MKLVLKSVVQMIASCALVVGVVAGTLGVAEVEMGCAAKTCSSSEEQACTSAYTNCISEAAASADTNKCQQCIETYCSCYDSCGNSCDRGKLGGECGGTK